MDTPTHELSMTVLMTPDMANFAGNVHGGTLLKFLDQVAYACASRYAARYVVTLSVDQVTFREPIQVGELVTFLASVNHTGNTSMEIGIKVIAEEIRTQRKRHVNSCFFTMVAVDADRKLRYERITARGASTDHVDFDTWVMQEEREREQDKKRYDENTKLDRHPPGEHNRIHIELVVKPPADCE